MKETFKKLAGKALPWCFWGSIGCSVLVVLISIFLWIGAQYHLDNYKTEGFYAKTMANNFVDECYGFMSPFGAIGFWAGLFALGCGFLTRQFKRPIVALSVVVGSAILFGGVLGSLWWAASGYDNALSDKPGYTQAKEIDKQLCLSLNLASGVSRAGQMSESMYRQIENSVSEARNYNRETVKMICAGADSSTIESRNHNARQQAGIISQTVLDVHNNKRSSGNGGYDGGYDGGYNGGYNGGYDGGYNGGY